MLKCQINSRIRIFALTQILIKNHRKYYVSHAKRFSYPTKDHYFLRFHDDSRNTFVNVNEVIFYIFNNATKTLMLLTMLFVWTENSKEH